MDEIYQQYANYAQGIDSEGSASVEGEEKGPSSQSGALQREHQHQAGMDEEHEDAQLTQMSLEFRKRNLASIEMKQMCGKYAHYCYRAEYV